MKFKLLLCGAALLVAGCASSENQFATSGEYSFNNDLVPQPVELTPSEMDVVEHTPINSFQDTFKGIVTRSDLSQQ